MIPPIDVAAELEALGGALAACEALRESLGPRAGARAPALSGWSAEQHLYHAALATDLSLGNVRSLVAGVGPRIVHDGELGPDARALFERGSFPRGVAEAPRMVRPPEAVDPEFLAQEQRRNREAWEALAADTPELHGVAGRIPHQILGPLSAAEWLVFARMHLEHHLAIAREVAEARASDPG